MIVCMDIQAGVGQRAGVGRYTQSLVEHLGPQAGADELRLFYFDFQRRGTPWGTPGARQRAVRWVPGRVVQKAWKTIRWPPFNWFAGAADVYHFPNFIVPPLTRGRAVVTIHDVSFLRFPEAAEEKNRRYLTAQIRDTVARADAIITDSAFSGREIQDLLGVSHARLLEQRLGAAQGHELPAIGPRRAPEMAYPNRAGRVHVPQAGQGGGSHQDDLVVDRYARRHGIDPFVYLRDLLTRIPTHPQSRIYELFPDNWLKLSQEPATPAEVSSN